MEALLLNVAYKFTPQEKLNWIDKSLIILPFNLALVDVCFQYCWNNIQLYLKWKSIAQTCFWITVHFQWWGNKCELPSVRVIQSNCLPTSGLTSTQSTLLWALSLCLLNTDRHGAHPFLLVTCDKLMLTAPQEMPTAGLCVTVCDIRCSIQAASSCQTAPQQGAPGETLHLLLDEKYMSSELVEMLERCKWIAAWRPWHDWDKDCGRKMRMRCKSTVTDSKCWWEREADKIRWWVVGKCADYRRINVNKIICK